MRCSGCGFRLETADGIVHALAPDVAAELAGFMRHYAAIRRAEGRGDEGAAYYLGLPRVDRIAPDAAQWRMRAITFACVLRLLRAMPSARVLDLGAGNGWMSYRSALAGHRPVAVDLSLDDRDGLGAARHYGARLPALFPRLQASFDRLPFADGQFDAAIFNASFHYASDGERSLREALRCVRPGGLAMIVDTPWYPNEGDGHRMLAERTAAFRQQHGVEAEGMPMLGFLTDGRLRALQETLGIAWEVHAPWYGIAWAMRPAVAAVRGRRRPSRFRVYAARKPA
jgi:SAM-dependent methyltransferase